MIVWAKNLHLGEQHIEIVYNFAAFKKNKYRYYRFLKAKENEKISIFVRSIRCCIFRILR